MENQNKKLRAQKWVYVHHFDGFPKDNDLKLEEEDIPELKNGEILIQAVALSLDPYMRMYSAHMVEGMTMIGMQVAKIIRSRNDQYVAGQHVVTDALIGWRTHTVVRDTSKIHFLPPMGSLPLSLGIGLMGMPGATAYFGIEEVLQPKSGEVVFVNSAAGSIGSIVGQLAKLKGCYVIGSAGSDEKCRWIKSELGFDYALNYKSCDIATALKKAAPDGIDCYYDNVGGRFSVEVLKHMKLFGRVAVCGCIAAYNDVQGEPSTGPYPWRDILVKQLKIEGFMVTQWKERFPEAFTAIRTLIEQGKLKHREHKTRGFKNMKSAFYGMLQGENIGKAVVIV